MKRMLWESLMDWFEAAQPIGEARNWVRVTGMEVDAPIELTLRPNAAADGGYDVLADVPRWRMASGFDVPASRLQVTLGLSGREEQLL